MAKQLNLKVIWPTPINVNAKARLPGDVFVEEESEEIKTLLRHQYLEVVKAVPQMSHRPEAARQPGIEADLTERGDHDAKTVPKENSGGGRLNP